MPGTDLASGGVGSNRAKLVRPANFFVRPEADGRRTTDGDVASVVPESPLSLYPPVMCRSPAEVGSEPEIEEGMKSFPRTGHAGRRIKTKTDCKLRSTAIEGIAA